MRLFDGYRAGFPGRLFSCGTRAAENGPTADEQGRTRDEMMESTQIRTLETTSTNPVRNWRSRNGSPATHEEPPDRSSDISDTRPTAPRVPNSPSDPNCPSDDGRARACAQAARSSRPAAQGCRGGG